MFLAVRTNNLWCCTLLFVTPLVLARFFFNVRYVK